jgi:hypothetical protein
MWNKTIMRNPIFSKNRISLRTIMRNPIFPKNRISLRICGVAMKTLFGKNRATKRNGRIVALLALLLSPQMAALAFPDSYEPDDNQAQATVIVVSAQKPPQHTLHSLEDEDWFKFYARADVRYNIVVESVGADIRIQLELYDAKGNLREKVNGYQGENVLLSRWQAPSDDVYYVKVSDTANPSESCRLNIQYQLQVSRGLAPTSGQVQGIITDAHSGKPIEDATVYTNCNENDTSISFADGNYRLIHNCPIGLYELTAEAVGYRTLTCHTPIPEMVSIQRDIALLPDSDSALAPTPAQLAFRNGDTLRASQPLYHNGEQLKVEFQLYRLPPDICVRYFAGIAYPDGRFFIITESNQFEPFDGKSLLHWTGIGNAVIDKPADDMPAGDYSLYLLRLPASIEGPIHHLDKGELNVTKFRVE